MRIRVVLAALPLVLLAACGSGATPNQTTGTPTTDTTSSTATSTSAPTTTPSVLGPSVPAATAVASPVARDQLPQVSGKFGEKPTLTFPKGDPVPSLQRVILSEGDGPVVGKGDWLVTNYLGQIWGGKVFDNSYDRHATSTFQIGVGQVVPGWDVGLVGVKVGSRVLLSLPPADGYGLQGSAQAGITGSDTIVFVVDIVKAYTENAAGQTDAKPQPAVKDAPEVKGALGKKPTVTVPKGLAAPAKARTIVLAKGTGPAVKEGAILAQYDAVTWDNQPAASTWPDAQLAASGQGGTGPEQLQIQSGSPFADLIGVPVGSRVLIEIPASTDQSTGQQSPALAVALDIVAQTVG